MSEDLSALQRLLDQRYSCRGFLEKPVPQATIGEIVKTAQKVPSWCNSQPWQLAICSPEKTKVLADALTEAAMGGMQSPDVGFPETLSGCLQRIAAPACGWQLYDAVGVTKGDREASLQTNDGELLFLWRAAGCCCYHA